MMNQACNFSPGTKILGKWNGNSYTIIKLLGQGATGNVFLADSRQGKVAVKLSENSMAITSETNVLKHFSKVQGHSLGPSLLDVDDVKVGSQKLLSFYVMEYIEGHNLLQFVNERGIEWTDVLVLQLLTNLDSLHKEGWVFGDLKPDNLIISGPPPKIRCIDVGGTTQQGRSIKEFTEFFDRGYWGMGTRKAEPSYDLFAVAMIMVNAAYPKRFSKRSDVDGKEQLLSLFDQHSYLRKHKDVLKQAILGNYKSALDMKSDFIKLLSEGTKQNQSQTRSSSKTYRTHIPQKTSKKQQSQSLRKRAKSTQTRSQVVIKKKRRKSSGFLETLIILISVFVIYSLYVYHILL
ncbi:protein kinase domain-containing protein [Bacillus weihaiensis]|uniref:Serine/threonine protein kinase n=1 Tax=Bacillus weihaiensis TaxID=1547283 RepID=A0A1L3MWP5_9BACI|nr:protein kinase [Bacillus weihaiensis]APH06710.1 serine/threonine protein kinase [Bacillus weihaiensis]